MTFRNMLAHHIQGSSPKLLRASVAQSNRDLWSQPLVSTFFPVLLGTRVNQTGSHRLCSSSSQGFPDENRLLLSNVGTSKHAPVLPSLNWDAVCKARQLKRPGDRCDLMATGGKTK